MEFSRIALVELEEKLSRTNEDQSRRKRENMRRQTNLCKDEEERAREGRSSRMRVCRFKERGRYRETYRSEKGDAKRAVRRCMQLGGGLCKSLSVYSLADRFPCYYATMRRETGDAYPLSVFLLISVLKLEAGKVDETLATFDVAGKLLSRPHHVYVN